MSSGSHLSKELHDLVKSIGETRSKQEEDKIIIKELTILRNKLQEKNINPKKMKEHLIRAIYIEMLGHDASFAHIHAVNLTQSKILQLKKMGYLCCSLFLDSNSDLLILLVATLQRDLTSTNIHEIVIALTAVSKLISHSFVSALVEPITKLLNHQTDIIRKKSLIVLQKFKQMNNAAISDFDYEERMRRALQDKESSVVGAALNLYHEEMKKGNIAKYKPLASNFVALLKQIIEHKLHKDFDYHRFPAPWLQIKILQILAFLGASDLRVSEQVYEVLGSTLRRADDTTINIGYAVTYQCVKTIATLYPNQQLIEQAAQSVSRFLKSDNNNLKYLGINALIQIVIIHPKYVVEHQMTIVDCLESPDDTLKKETLELLFKMTNENNIEVILNKLIQFLKSSSDASFKKDLFAKISTLNEKHAPTQEWFIRTANTVFEYGSEFIDNDVLNNFFKLINDNFYEIGTQFGEFIIEIYLEILSKANLSDNMIKLIAWVVGEIGSQTYENNTPKLNELTESIIQLLGNVYEDELTISWIITALAKLQSAKGFQMFDQTRGVFEKYKTSKYMDCQQRSMDFQKLAKYNAALKRSNQIIVDKSLSFLNNFVQGEIKKGAQTYNNSLSVKAAGLSSGAIEQTLNFEPYNGEKYLTKSSNAHVLGSAQKDDTGIKQRGPTIWTDEGYTKKETQPQPVVKPAGQQTMAIGSANIAEPKKQNTATTGSTGMQGIGSQSYQGTTQPPPQAVSTFKAQEKKEDPVNKEKQQLANSLFAGLSTQNKPQTQFKPQQSKPQNVQPQSQTKPNDLLDFLSDDQPKQPQQQQSQVKPTQQQTFNLFDLGTSQQPQKSIFSPLNLNLEGYEKNWESLTLLKEETVKTRIRNEKDFRDFTTYLNIKIIEIIGEDIICAGQNSISQSPLLLYGVYNASGSLQIQMKSKNLLDMEFVIQTLKRNFQ